MSEFWEIYSSLFARWLFSSSDDICDNLQGELYGRTMYEWMQRYRLTLEQAYYWLAWMHRLTGWVDVRLLRGTWRGLLN
jgi:hypothetical protein